MNGGPPLRTVVAAAACALMAPALASADQLTGEGQSAAREEPSVRVQVATSRDPVSQNWDFQVTPYIWFLSADGDVTVRGQESDVDLSFRDILDDLNYALMIEGEARKGRLGAFANLIYADLEDSSNVQGIKIDAEVDELWLGFGAYYRLGPWSLGEAGQENPASVTVDPYVGARYTYLDLELDVQGGPTAEGDKDWVEPIVGVRTLWDLSERWTLTVAGDVGGFGIGSDFAWHAFGLVGYRFGLFGDDDARILGGYRALHQDYDSGSGANKFEWDVTLHGPTMALAVQF